MLPEAIVTLATEKKSKGRHYLLKIACAESVKGNDDTDSSGNNVTKGTKHLEGYFQDSYNGVIQFLKRGQYSTRKVLRVSFQVTEGKKGLILSNNEFRLIMEIIRGFWLHYCS